MLIKLMYEMYATVLMALPNKEPELVLAQSFRILIRSCGKIHLGEVSWPKACDAGFASTTMRECAIWIVARHQQGVRCLLKLLIHRCAILTLKRNKKKIE